MNSDAQRYAEEHTSPEPPLLARINRDTHAMVLHPNMLSGHLQGRLLAMISHMVNPRLVVEIGTFTGYSALCLAEGLQSDGRLITIDINDELESRVRGYIDSAGLTERIEYRLGNAADILSTIEGPIDLVFIDADKSRYGVYYDLVIDRVRPGGFILVDNVLRQGKVMGEHRPKEGVIMDAFNKKIRADVRVEQLLLPVRDGIFIIRKLSLQNF